LQLTLTKKKTLSEFIKDPLTRKNAKEKVKQTITSLSKEDISVYKEKGIDEPAKNWLSVHHRDKMAVFKATVNQVLKPGLPQPNETYSNSITLKR